MSARRLVGYVAFALMLAGLLFSLQGQEIERNSFRKLDREDLEEGAVRSRERQEANRLKNQGVGLVFAGCGIWLVGSMIFRRRDHRDKTIKPDNLANRPSPQA
jgi:hypothetical protein